jgi:putative transposase
MFTTTVFSQCSSGWFRASPRRATLEDQQNSISHTAPRSAKHHPSPPPAFVFTTRPSNTAFPARFPSIEAARAHCQEFFPWYNNDHRHGGLGLHTAADVHHGHAQAVRAGRAQVLDAAYLAHPERFVRKPPAPPKLPGTSWINPPQDKETGTQ